MQKSVQAKENRIIFKTYGQFRCGIAHFLNCKLRLIGSYFALMLICVACSNGHFLLTGLMKYRNKSFWEGHKTITFDTLTDRHQYEVIAVFKTVVYTNSSDSFKYYEFTDAENAAEFDAYVAKCKELSLYDTGVSAEYGDKLISLSTCEYSRNNGRLVVVAKKISE